MSPINPSLSRGHGGSFFSARVARCRLGQPCRLQELFLCYHRDLLYLVHLLRSVPIQLLIAYQPPRKLRDILRMHKRDEVQAFAYDEDILLEDFNAQGFLDFLGVDKTFDPPSSKQPTGGKKAGKKATGKKTTEEKASGGVDAEVGTEANAEIDAEARAKARAKARAEAGEFSRKYFVRAANSMAKSIKEKCDYLISLRMSFF
jgi:hypothetical protein